MIRVEVHGARLTDEQQMAVEDFARDLLEPARIEGLTRIESAIVRALMWARGEWVSNETLVSRIARPGMDPPDVTTIRPHITHIRAKGWRIGNRYGGFYRLEGRA